MSELYPRISIVTATYNQGSYIEDTILSILNQEYPNLEYIIIDGGSTDNTLDVIRKYESRISFWVSEKDSGLYDALDKGFKKTTGEIMGWLNSDDILHHHSLFSIAEIFNCNKEVDWVQGYPTVINDSGKIIFHRPHRYSKYSFYLKEYYDGVFIQQESTFWRRNLWERSGATISTAYKYAGDFELWMRFYRHADLYITQAMIGSFRVRQGQLSSENYSAYLMECDKITDNAVSELPVRELNTLNKIRRYKKMMRSFPLLARLIMVYRAVADADKPRKVDYDLREAAFRIYS